MNVDNSDASASTSITAVKRVSVIRLVAKVPGNDNKVASVRETSEINDGQLLTIRSNQMSLLENEKLDTELCGNSSLKSEVSCPESQTILKYIHKKFGKRKHDEDSPGPSEVFRPESVNR